MRFVSFAFFILIATVIYAQEGSDTSKINPSNEKLLMILNSLVEYKPEMNLELPTYKINFKYNIRPLMRKQEDIITDIYSSLKKNLEYKTLEEQFYDNIMNNDNPIIKILGTTAIFVLGSGSSNLFLRCEQPYTQLLGGKFPGLFNVIDLGPNPTFDYVIFNSPSFDSRVYKDENPIPKPFDPEEYKKQYYNKKSKQQPFEN